MLEVQGGILFRISEFLEKNSINPIRSFILVPIILVILAAITLIDRRRMEIPNRLNVVLLIVAVLSVISQGFFYFHEKGWIFGGVQVYKQILPTHILGFFCISVPMLVIALIIPGGFGGGDIKLMAVAGFLLGWQEICFAFVIAIFLGGCKSVWLLIVKRAGRKTQFAFGPFLCIGIACALIYPML